LILFGIRDIQLMHYAFSLENKVLVQVWESGFSNCRPNLYNLVVKIFIEHGHDVTLSIRLKEPLRSPLAIHCDLSQPTSKLLNHLPVKLLPGLLDLRCLRPLTGLPGIFHILFTLLLDRCCRLQGRRRDSPPDTFSVFLLVFHNRAKRLLLKRVRSTPTTADYLWPTACCLNLKLKQILTAFLLLDRARGTVLGLR
jgi:hypothetical protein